MFPKKTSQEESVGTVDELNLRVQGSRLHALKLTETTTGPLQGPFPIGKETIPMSIRISMKLICLAVVLGGITACGSSEVSPTNTNLQTTPVRQFTNQRDGSILLEIPAGPFTMGSTPATVDEQLSRVREVYPDFAESDLTVEIPQHQVTLPTYYMGRTEVTIGQYRRFLRETGYRPVGDFFAISEGLADDIPATGVTWDDARAYCDWAGLRLPTESEWEKAARGTDERTWPWGNTFDTSLCASSVGGEFGASGGPSPVGSFPDGASPYGCLDMAGNVTEWTSTLVGPYPGGDPTNPAYGQGERVMRGGSWPDNTDVWLRCADRYWQPDTANQNSFGFRVASDSAVLSSPIGTADR